MDKPTKFCNGCKQDLPIEVFGIKTGPKAPKDGHRSRCKKCEVEAGKDYRARNREKVRETKRNWARKNPDKKAAMDLRYREKYPDKAKERSRNWQANNREYIREYRANRTPEQKERKRMQDIEYGRNNRPANREATRRYRANNPDKVKEVSKAYRQRNPEKMALKAMQRRAWKLEGGVYLITVKELQRLYAGVCIYCGSKENIEIDHIIPLVRGGRHSIGNLAPACQFCNRSKNKRVIMEWRLWKQRNIHF